eukprot:5992096-Lingulodinium_polyedra.AAC.1
MRPDLEVHVLCENVVSARDKLNMAMGKALGMDADTTRQRILRSLAGQWAAASYVAGHAPA